MNALGDNSKIENLLLHFWKMHLHDFLGPLGSSKSFRTSQVVTLNLHNEKNKSAKA